MCILPYPLYDILAIEADAINTSEFGYYDNDYYDIDWGNPGKIIKQTISGMIDYVIFIFQTS